MLISQSASIRQQVASLSPTGSILRNKWEKRWVQLRILRTLFAVALQESSHPRQAIRALRELKAKERRLFGDHPVSKVAKVDGRYFWRLGAVGFPSRAARNNFTFEIRRVLGRERAQTGLRLLFLAVTRKCPLKCAHCLEWNNLNGPEVLSREDLLAIVRKYQEFGVGQILFSGGEPLLRFKDILFLLRQAASGTDFWVITSGFSLTAEKALQLKAAGLTGLAVSIDDHRPAHHDRFRGMEGAFEQAVLAVAHAREAQLCTALYLCPTREFTTAEYLHDYMEFARRLGVAFVQWLEPRAVGHYEGQDVALTTAQVGQLEQLYETYNHDPDSVSTGLQTGIIFYIRL